MSAASPRPGLWREAPILLTAALALFVALAGATLVLYRGAVTRLEIEREGEALALARHLAGQAAESGAGQRGDLAALLPPDAHAALLDSGGHVLQNLSAAPALDMASDRLGALLAAAPEAIGPRRAGAPFVVAAAPFEVGGARRYARVALAADTLAAERRTVALLTPLVIGLALAAAIVVGLFFRAVTRPYRTLLERARLASDGALDPSLDEAGFLVATFDRALEDLSESERRHTRERLGEVVAQLGELAAGVAHEMRNSVATMRGWIDIAHRQELPESAVECLAELDRESRQLGRVVEDFLAFARPGSGRVEALDLVELLREAAHDPALGGVTVEVRASQGPATLTGDAQLLARAFRNLISNAARAERAAGRPGPVEIDLEVAAPGLRIRIADRGPGIPAALRSRLFEPFVSGQPGGVGLGLALARRIFLLHGGSVAASDREGGGTIVEVQLPTDTSATLGN